MEDCTHEEADKRIMLHVYIASHCGYRRVMIRTTDTDFVVLAVSEMQDIVVDKLWIAFGTGKHFRYLAIHDIAAQLWTPEGQGSSNAACPNRLRHRFFLFWQRETNSMGYLECFPCNN